MNSTDPKTQLQPPAVPAEPKWNEYKIFHLDGTLTPYNQHATETMLCELASQGWEYVWGDKDLRMVLMGRRWDGVPVIPEVPEQRNA